MKNHNQFCSGINRSLIATVLLAVMLAAPAAHATINAILQTYSGGTMDFVSTNAAGLSTNSLFMVFLSPTANGGGYNHADPADPTDGDILLGAYPLAGNGAPGYAGQITGYPSEVYTNAATGVIYVAVFDYMYSLYAVSNTVPAGTRYLLTTNSLVTAVEASGPGAITDVGGTLDTYAGVNGPWVAEHAVPDPADPTISLSTQLVVFSTPYNTDPASINFTLGNSGVTGSMNYTNQISYGPGASGWLTLQPSSGSLLPKSSTPVGCHVDVSGVNVGSYTAAITVVSAEATNSPQELAVQLTVSIANQSINFPTVGDQYISNTVALTATASSGLPVSYAVIEGPGSLAGSVLSFSGLGVVKVTASQAGDSNWNPANTVTQSINVVDTPPTGYLRCIIQPTNARRLGRWRIVGQSTWRSSGANVEVSSGGYTIEFLDTVGWDKPANLSATVTGGQTTTKTGTYIIHKVRNDFDGDGISDIGCYEPIYGYWYIYKSAEQTIWVTNYAGGAGTLPVTGDFDGDDICDYGTYYPPIGLWSIMRSRDGQWKNNFGFSGTVPVTGDLDGDGILDFGCYYDQNGWWNMYKSKEGFWSTQFGYAGTVPVTGDFDGDGIDDFGCYFAPDGWWYIYKSTTEKVWTTQFGYSDTVPVTGDFDGDGIDDFGCYYAEGGNWYLYLSRDGFQTKEFGYADTVPITGDYDGDGITDFGCYYAPSGNWYVFMSKTQELWVNEFGYEGTIPLK